MVNPNLGRVCLLLGFGFSIPSLEASRSKKNEKIMSNECVACEAVWPGKPATGRRQDVLLQCCEEMLREMDGTGKHTKGSDLSDLVPASQTLLFSLMSPRSLNREGDSGAHVIIKCRGDTG